MKTILRKRAETNIPLSPEESYQASQLFGKSLFSAIQLAKEQELKKRMLNKAMSGGSDGDVLRVPIPEHLLPQQKLANFEEGTPQRPGVLAKALKLNNHPARLLVGGQAGFRDAKKDYYMEEKNNISKQLMMAQREYIDLLQQIKTGEAYDDTPCVDAFCNGIAHYTMFEKCAEDPVNIEDGTLRRLAGDVANVAKRPFQPAVDFAATGLLGSAAGTAYLTYLLRKKMREGDDGYMDEGLPSRVEFQPYKQ